MDHVLQRDEHGRAILWQCVDCGKPFNKGWGMQCNACILAAERHREMVQAIKEAGRNV